MAGTFTLPDWAYVAALFDGEGSIVARGAADALHRRYVITIVQKDASPLEWIQATLQVGKIYFTNGTHRYHIQA